MTLAEQRPGAQPPGTSSLRRVAPAVRQVSEHPDPAGPPAPGVSALVTATGRPAGSEGPRGLLTHAAYVLGAAPAVAVVALGIPLLSLTVSSSSDRSPLATRALAASALLLVLVPAIVAALLPRARSATRVLVVLASTLGLEVARITVHAPALTFAFTSGSGVDRTSDLARIAETGDLGPALTSPGTAVVVSGVHVFSGLSLPISVALVSVLVRAVGALAVLLVVRHVSGSTRVATAAVLVQGAAPAFLTISVFPPPWVLAQALVLWSAYLVLTRQGHRVLAPVPAMTVAIPVAVCDVGTAVIGVVLFAAWAALSLRLEGRRSGEAWTVAAVALAGAAGLAVVLGAGLAPLLPAAEEVGATSRWSAAEAGLGVAATLVGLVVLGTALGRSRPLLRLRDPIVDGFLVLAAASPLALAGHLPGVAGAAVGPLAQRFAGFALLGAGFVVGWWLWQRPMTAARVTGLTVAGAVLFLGSVVVGAATPGPLGPSAAATVGRPERGPAASGAVATTSLISFVVRSPSTPAAAAAPLLGPAGDEDGPPDVAEVVGVSDAPS